MCFKTSRKDRWHADKIVGSMFLVNFSHGVTSCLIHHLNDATATQFLGRLGQSEPPWE